MRRLTCFYTQWPRTADALILALPVLLFYAPLLLGVRTFPDGDFTHHFLPFSLFQADSLRAGRLPLWNPYTYAGHPFLADTQAAVFYPPSNLLLALTLPLRDAAARLYLLQVEAVLQTILAGWFVSLLVRTLAGVRWAALLAGLTFALSGYLTGYPPLQLAVLRTAIWLPLILWLLLKAHGALAAGRRPWGWAIGAGAAIATAFLAGHPQTFVYIAYVTVAWVVLLTLQRFREGFGAALRFEAAALLAALVAFGLSLAQLLPSLEFVALSVRAAADYAFASGGFPLRDTWQMVLPGILTQYAPLYVGIPALALVTVAFFARTPDAPVREGLPLRTATWFWAGVALAALLLSYGGNSPLFRLFYRLPGFGAFRGQERAAYLVALALSLLAGIGAAQLATLPVQTRRRLALLFGAVVTASVYGAGLLLQLTGRTAVDNGSFLLIAIVALLLGVATALLLWLPGQEDRLPGRLIALTVAGLLLANFGVNSEAATPAAQVALPPEALALQAALAQEPTAAQGLPGRAANEFRVWENYGMAVGVEEVWGASPLRLATYARLAENFPLDRWWSLTGVSHVLTWRRELFMPSTTLGEWPQSSDTTWLHALQAPGARARVVTGVQVADDDGAWALLADHRFPLTSTAVLPPEAGIAARDPVETDEAAVIRISRPAPNQFEIEVESAGGLLLLSENWMPGWTVSATSQAESSGDDTSLPNVAPLTVVRANLSFVGVTIPAGKLQLRLEYDPASARLGLQGSGVTLALVVLAALWLTLSARLRRREAP